MELKLPFVCSLVRNIREKIKSGQNEKSICRKINAKNLPEKRGKHCPIQFLLLLQRNEVRNWINVKEAKDPLAKSFVRS